MDLRKKITQYRGLTEVTKNPRNPSGIQIEGGIYGPSVLAP